MQTFVQWLKFEESKTPLVHRIDNDRIPNFKDKLRTYDVSPTGNQSGVYDNPSDVPKGWHKETGLFAGNKKFIVPYATPRGTSFATYIDEGKPTVAFNIADKAKIKNHKPYLSSFQASNFTKKGGEGQYFSPEPPMHVSQEPVRNPLSLIGQWYKIVFVPNLGQHIIDLENRGIQYEGENIQVPS